jgi:hypothetical protein
MQACGSSTLVEPPLVGLGLAASRSRAPAGHTPAPSTSGPPSLAAGTLRTLVLLLSARYAALLAGSQASARRTGHTGCGDAGSMSLHNSPPLVQLYLTAPVSLLLFCSRIKGCQN